MGSFFDDVSEALESKAYAEYCETLYGRRLRLDGALIEEDLDALLALAGCARNGRVLDCGCGSGDLLRFLCARLDAEGVGVDPSPACLAGPAPRSGLSGLGAEGGEMPRSSFPRGPAEEEARLEARAEGRIAFYRTRAEDCRGVSGLFDLVLAIDSLSACRDASAALERMACFLAPGGTLLIAHTERIAPGTPVAAKDPRLEFSRGSLSRALSGRGFIARGFEIKGREITRSEQLHWKLSRRLLGKLEADCAAEGRPRVHAAIAGLTARMNASVEREDFRRYWYRIRRSG